jgi:hypothetical protein
MPLYRAQRRRAVLAAQTAARRRAVIAFLLCISGLITGALTLANEIRIQQQEMHRG